MTRPDDPRRRAFLCALGAGAAAGGVAPALLAALAGCAREEPLSDALAAFFADPEHARVVGRAFLEAHPEEGDADSLARRIAGGERDDWRARVADPPALAASVRARHRLDFEHGRVVRVHGWVLSETEARLCALAALAG